MKPILGEVIAAVVLLMLASVSCSTQSQEAAAAAPLPTATSAVLLQDNFSNIASGWDTTAYPDNSVEYESGGLHMQTVKPGDFVWSNPNTVAYENAHVEVTVKNLGGDPHAGFGLLCDQQPSAGSYYYFAITPAGEYEIGKSVMGQQNIVLTGNGNWSTTDLISPNAASYRLGADCGQGTLTLYVDGRTIDSVRDLAYGKGEVGVFLWTAQAAPGDVLYDDFAVTRLR